MKFVPLPIPGTYLVHLERRGDNRGAFERVFCLSEFDSVGLAKPIVQVNRSFTQSRGTVRGMHYQLPPFAETKTITCLRGAVYDVIVDLRKGSATFLRWHGEVLRENDDKTMVVPEGVAHGFQTLDDETELLYLHSALYSAEHERGVAHDEPRIGIKWPLAVTELSIRDRGHDALPPTFEGIAVG
jgi:dTDP-4-dehydrorhamnose 3,5-epimerase